MQENDNDKDLEEKQEEIFTAEESERLKEISKKRSEITNILYTTFKTDHKIYSAEELMFMGKTIDSMLAGGTKEILDIKKLQLKTQKVENDAEISKAIGDVIMENSKRAALAKQANLKIEDKIKDIEVDDMVPGETNIGKADLSLDDYKPKDD